MILKNFKLEVEKTGICILSIDTENSEINTVNTSVINEFEYVVNKLTNDEDIKGVIINSLKKDFHFGYNLKELLKIKDKETLFNIIIKQNKILRTLESSGKKVVSILKGKTFSGGLEIALSSHYRVAADDPETLFAIKDLNFGLCMGMGGSQRLPRLIGINQTIDLIINRKSLTASEALKIKIINEIVAKNQLMKRAKEIILDDSTFVQPWDDKNNKDSKLKPFDEKNFGFFIGTISKTHSITKNHYPGVKTFMSCLFEGLNSNIDSGTKIESRNFVWLLNHQETKAMIKTLVINKPRKNLLNSSIKELANILRKNYAAEGIRLLLQGVSPAIIENAGKRIGCSEGPLATADTIEIKNIINQLDFSDANVTAFIGLMEQKSRKGKSSGAGFYDYKNTVRIKIWKGLEELVALSKTQPEVFKIETRLLFILVNKFSSEADNYMKNNKIEEQDYFSIKKCNFPAWTGGPYSWIKNYGIEKFIEESNDFAENLGPRFIPSKKILTLVKN
ncbi:MAG: Fatty acid oxidation complex subunit alpha [Alphaproteobacteria bacterium MarineAlpha9_Bin2]|nr:MAG: Fatty acid oxidation complex subunit alpha [Alphaproteobacteria bacterium MarineAlpha9_Bin2]